MGTNETAQERRRGLLVGAVALMVLTGGAATGRTTLPDGAATGTVTVSTPCDASSNLTTVPPLCRVVIHTPLR